MDIWSTGCILAELLGGKPIFKVCPSRSQPPSSRLTSCRGLTSLMSHDGPLGMAGQRRSVAAQHDPGCRRYTLARLHPSNLLTPSASFRGFPHLLQESGCLTLICTRSNRRVTTFSRSHIDRLHPFRTSSPARQPSLWTCSESVWLSTRPKGSGWWKLSSMNIWRNGIGTASRKSARRCVSPAALRQKPRHLSKLITILGFK